MEIKRDLQYDVFINHRGTDVKKGLASIIYNLFKIKDCRLQVFLDQKEIRCGVDVSTAIEAAIKSSHVHIAIFSERYAESKWCLDELVSILGSKRKVIPVFYDVEPTALRYINSGCYQKAFEKHRRRVTVEKTEKWKKALLDASLLKGELCNTKEHDLWDFSQKIVDIVLKEFEQESLAVTKEQAAKDFPIGASELDDFKFIKEFITEEFALANEPDEDRLDLSVLLQAVEDRADLRDLFEADEYGPAVSELFEEDEDGATLSELLEADQKDGPTLSELTTEADEDGPAVSAASQNLAPHPYVLLLPIIDGQFRASLQPGEDDSVDVCLESCSDKVRGSSFRSCVYVHAGADPFDLMKDAMRAVRYHLGTFRLLEEKTPPGIINKFGWCTWDAFYLTVKPEGVWEGVQRLAEGGCPPGLVLIDDGWQSISHDADPSKEAMALTVAGEQMPCRLTRFEENYKFSSYVGGTLPKKQQPDNDTDVAESEPQVGMGAFVRDLKSEFRNLEYVYVWHALCGYWGGVRPRATTLPAEILTPSLSPGLLTTMKDLAVDKIVDNGIGFVPPERAHDMYEAMHSYLAQAGIDGVKVDVIHVLELLCQELGGRVDLNKTYFEGLSASVRKHFNGNGVIASMEHGSDFVYLGTDQICVGRVGDDFWPCSDPNDPNGLDPNDTYWLQGCHMVHCAFNSLWMGQVMQPDWDMFQTTHPCAEFHAASRAISGGPIYVSDKVGQHDFALLKRLVLPDGSILRCRHYALPTRSCLFNDPLHNGETMLKIWNLNKYSGVVGAFNCQGGGWNKEERSNMCFSQFSKRVRSTVSTKDVEWYQVSDPMVVVEGVEEFAVYFFRAQKLCLIGPTDEIPVELDPFQFELFTILPVKMMPRGIRFAAVGLVNMLNTGGAVESVRCWGGRATVEVRGCGEMWAYASPKPKLCKLNGAEVDFVYGIDDGTVRIEVPWNGGSNTSLEYVF